MKREGKFTFKEALPTFNLQPMNLTNRKLFNNYANHQHIIHLLKLTLPVVEVV